MKTIDEYDKNYILETSNKQCNSLGVKLRAVVLVGSISHGVDRAGSDYDVRFIYSKPEECYKGLIDNLPDNTSFKTEYGGKEFDFVGYDLKKAMTLLHNSNITVLEWVMSDYFLYGEKFMLRLYSSVNPYCFYTRKIIKSFLAHASNVKGVKNEQKKSITEFKLLLFAYAICYKRQLQSFDVFQLMDSDIHIPRVNLIKQAVIKYKDDKDFENIDLLVLLHIKAFFREYVETELIVMEDFNAVDAKVAIKQLFYDLAYGEKLEDN